MPFLPVVRHQIYLVTTCVVFFNTILRSQCNIDLDADQIRSNMYKATLSLSS